MSATDQLAADVVAAADLDPDVRPWIEFEADSSPLSAIYDAVMLSRVDLPVPILDRVDALVDDGGYAGTGLDTDLRQQIAASRAVA